MDFWIYWLQGEDYTRSMDTSRFASAGPSPVMSGSFKEPDGLFGVQRGTFSEPRGMFMPTGSEQQNDAIARAKKLGMRPF